MAASIPDSSVRLRRLTDAGLAPLLATGLRGIEKESLRVGADGRLARSPHPRCLGSALTHPAITTDYSEALLEFITQPQRSVQDALDELADIHAYTYSCLGDELLWVTSMPCVIGDEAEIPIAEYGSSNVGTMKHVYRRGLAWRYGKAMQCIAGVHFNFSFAEELWSRLAELDHHEGPLRDLRDARYFGLVRNFHRYGWLVPLLFGASPAVCRSFQRERPEGFAAFDAGTWYMPHATSLRMSDIGYRNANQAGLAICYSDLASYVDSLSGAIRTPSPEYASYGVEVDGEWRQLNANILQIENEFYSFIRPKQVAESGEMPTLALRRRGVSYVEIRALDVAAFDPLGVNPSQLHFLECLMLLCFLDPSPPISADEQRARETNQTLVATRGREPGLELSRDGEAQGLGDWAAELLDRMRPIAETMDSVHGGDAYRRALEWQAERIRDPDLMPSALMLQTMRDTGEPYVDFAWRMAHEHRDWFRDRQLDEEVEQRYAAQARDSLQEQAQIEAADELSFEEYLERYFAQDDRPGQPGT